MVKQPSSTRAERLRDNSRNRRDQQKQEVREAILQAASALFLEHGYAGFSIRQVAEKIGYSPGIIYFYFADKDEVLFTLVDEGFSRFGERFLRAFESTTDARERLLRMARVYLEFGMGHPAHYQLMFMQRTDYFLRPVLENPNKLRTFDLLTRAVEDAMGQNVLLPGDLVSTSDTLWATLHGCVCLAILMPGFDESRAQAMVERALTLVTRGLHPG
ncbi:MAG: TetR/AcrR family transcriptional regulator [Pleurocapsa minor GSE-CHR-MK-17-07R]|jgi:AcrR family transcriptional regulator|nr:TetR/AcrR family transcriptional regulator [Pleurocapsa minor GSE-CHR-MK 17-07R]